MNFERFMNTERVSLADIDTDWSPNHRELVKNYIYSKEDLYCADIITFNTVALKGSIRDVCRALYKKELTKELKDKMDMDDEGYGKLTDETSKKVHDYVDGEYLKISNYICENIETNEDKMRKEYPEVFEYVDIINGTIVSIGTHPCGQICSPIPLDSAIGLCSISTCSHPVSMISMKAIDSQNFVKLDLLGLDNIQIINETCELANIERLTPENTPDEEAVWQSMAKDNTLIFQWESDSAGAFLKTLLSEKTLNKIKQVNPNFRYVDLVSMGNGAIRPAGASYRNALSNGEFRDNGHEALNKFLAPTMGYLVYQEQIMNFLHEFCGYTMGEADIVRRGFAKKTGTEKFIPKITSGFINTMKEKYDVDEEESKKLIVNFIQVITDASDYLFSENHAVPYTYIGYIGGYLRYYHTLEFITTALNINKDKEEKTISITQYANSKGIKISSPKFGYAKASYFMSKETNSIYKGVGSLKNLNNKVADELYELSQNNKYNTFLDLLLDIKENTSCNSRQLEILIKLDYFDYFGKAQKLLTIVNLYNKLYGKKQFSKAKLSDESIDLIRKYSNKETEKVFKEVDTYKLLIDQVLNIPNKDISFKEKLVFQNEVLGYIDYKNDKIEKRYALITDINTKYTPIVNTYCLNNGVTCKCKINKKLWNNDGELHTNDVIYIHSMEKKFGWKKVGEKTDKKGNIKPVFEVDENKTEWHITNYSVIPNMEEILDEI
jgi:DNA polymerase-3 subunit alpha